MARAPGDLPRVPSFGKLRINPGLFQEANPMPIKYCLWRQGLIRSAECRLPLTQISQGLAAAIDHALEVAGAEVLVPGRG